MMGKDKLRREKLYLHMDETVISGCWYNIPLTKCQADFFRKLYYSFTDC